MHELFLTASVPGDNVKETLRILQGLCGLKPVHKYERILTFEGPQSLLVAVPASRIQNRRPQDREPWNELNKQLIRQSYYINLVYPVGQSQFGRNAGEADDQSPIKPIIDIEETRGTLQFLDYPDPPHPARPVNSRLVVHIRDEPKLPSLLQSIRYRYFSERLHEAYEVYRDNVTFTLSRELQRSTPNGPSERRGSIPQILPALEDFVPFDAENKWVLKVSVEVTDEKEGPLMQRGIDELLKAQNDLAGLYEFVILNRMVLDTRVPAFLENLRRR